MEQGDFLASVKDQYERYPCREPMQLSNSLRLRHRDILPLPTRAEMQARLEG